MDNTEQNNSMDMNHAILNYFTHRKIVDTLARYDLYYTIALMHITNTILNDQEKTNKLLDELNLQMNPELVFETMYHILKEYHADENLFTIFEDNIKIQAILKALDDLTHNYDDIPKLDSFIQNTQSSIISGQFFSEDMDKIFHSHLEEHIQYWGDILDIKTSEQILHAIQNMEYEY